VASQAASSDLRLTGFPLDLLDTSAPVTPCGYLGRLRPGQAILLRLEGVGLLRAAAVSIHVPGGVASVRRLSLYDYAVTGEEIGEAVPSGRVVFLDASVVYVPFTAHVPFAHRQRGEIAAFATVGLLRVEEY
jgi:hypothetical protein